MIESRLDREELDFELRVSSAGIDHPLTLHRQYLKNVGRNIEFDLQDGSRLTAKLLEVHPEHVLVERLAEKKRNKIKQLQSEGSMQLAFTDIAKALVQISFN
jgi:ribosome maturation factor RimP